MMAGRSHVVKDDGRKKSTVSGTRKHKRRFSAKSRQPRAEQRNDGKNTNLNWANFQRWPPSSSGSLNGRLQPGGTLEGLNVDKTSLPLFLFLCWFPRQLRDSLFRILGSTERDLRPLRSAIRLSLQFFSSASPQLLLLLLDHPAENKHTKKRMGTTPRRLLQIRQGASACFQSKPGGSRSGTGSGIFLRGES